MKFFHAIHVKRLVVLLGFLLVCGCGMTRMYEGPARHREEVAVIQGTKGVLSHVSILRVDDRAVGLTDSSAEILPGKHRVRLHRSKGNTWTQGSLEFEAKGGHTYQADGETTGFFPAEEWIWIVDLDDGTVVAGQRPPK